MPQSTKVKAYPRSACRYLRPRHRLGRRNYSKMAKNPSSTQPVRLPGVTNAESLEKGALSSLASPRQQYSVYVEGTWGSGICDCFKDCGTFCCGFLCPFCLHAHNKRLLTGSGLCGHCLLNFACPLYCILVDGPDVRRQLRAKYDLPEQPCGDCCVYWWCSCLASCQEGRELKLRGVTTFVPVPASRQSSETQPKPRTPKANNLDNDGNVIMMAPTSQRVNWELEAEEEAKIKG